MEGAADEFGRLGSGARGNHPDNGWSGALEEFRLWAEPCGDSKIGIGRLIEGGSTFGREIILCRGWAS